MLASVSIWLRLCVFVASYREGVRAYGAPCSPATMWKSSRSTTWIRRKTSSTQESPATRSSYRRVRHQLDQRCIRLLHALKDMRNKLRAAQDATRAFVHALSRGENPGPESTVSLLRQLPAFRAYEETLQP
jgi:hypothetical protein